MGCMAQNKEFKHNSNIPTVKHGGGSVKAWGKDYAAA